jgi:predicted lipoprotein with Yx(FWY)xxD motif
VRSRNLFAAFGIAAIALIALAGCGGGSSSSNSTSASGGGLYGGATTTPATTTGAGAATVSTGVTNNAKIGKKPVLVDSKGRTLYRFYKDTATKSNCNGGCAGVWPPLLTTGAAKATKGAITSKLGTIKRSDGSTQVTYAGFPLYTYTLDKKPGDAVGNDISSFGDKWYALIPSGANASS